MNISKERRFPISSNDYEKLLLFFQPIRRCIIRFLHKEGKMEFRVLKDKVETTRENIFYHCKVLSNSGYLQNHYHVENGSNIVIRELELDDSLFLDLGILQEKFKQIKEQEMDEIRKKDTYRKIKATFEPDKWAVLNVLERNFDSSIKNIAEKTGIERRKVSTILKSLQDKNLVESTYKINGKIAERHNNIRESFFLNLSIIKKTIVNYLQ